MKFKKGPINISRNKNKWSYTQISSPSSHTIFRWSFSTIFIKYTTLFMHKLTFDLVKIFTIYDSNIKNIFSWVTFHWLGSLTSSGYIYQQNYMSIEKNFFFNIINFTFKGPNYNYLKFRSLTFKTLRKSKIKI